MNIENPTNSTSEERQHLEREQDELFAQLKSDPDNIDAREELTKTLEQIKALSGPENTNINLMLQKLNEKADIDELLENLNPPAETNAPHEKSKNNANATSSFLKRIKKPFVSKRVEYIETFAKDEPELSKMIDLQVEIELLIEQIPDGEGKKEFQKKKYILDEESKKFEDVNTGAFSPNEWLIIHNKYTLLLEEIKIVAKKS